MGLEFHRSTLWPVMVRKSTPLPEDMDENTFGIAFDYLVAGNRLGYKDGHTEGYKEGLQEGYEARLDDVREAIRQELVAGIVARPGPRFDQLCELRGDYARARRVREHWRAIGFDPV